MNIVDREAVDLSEMYRIMDHWEGMGWVRLKSGERHTPDAVYEHTEFGKKYVLPLVKEMRRKDEQKEKRAERSKRCQTTKQSS